ncbi:MAG: DUF3786 domain-containing protein [Candidatus Caldarchaeum sp.]|nr:DUF3786 domain-containing protein [Candidatus Caldarchaeum sp.]MDW8063906.1 DUF3786 domain-containing protein [Candidatus Caldarchaeum sp.]MDW8435715.1 DUF3786 domain-containing protein [Candidatus Caldarchaeum sp.]
MKPVEHQPDASPNTISGWVREDFEKIRNLNHVATMKKCEVVYLPGSQQKPGRYIVNVLHKTYTVELDGEMVVDLMTGKQAGEKLSYVILEYLLGEGSTGGDSWLPLETILKQPPYLYHYQKYVARTLEKTFGYDKQLFEEISRSIGGKKEKLGGTAYSYTFLPKVRPLIQIWFGDETELRKPSISTSYNAAAQKFLKPTPLLFVFELLTDFMVKAIKKKKT